MTESCLKLLKLSIFKPDIDKKILILYPPCYSNKKYRPSGPSAAPHFLCHRLLGMGNHSRTVSSLVLGYFQRLIDSGISSTNLLQGSSHAL